MADPTPQHADPRDTEESDQLPEEQPAPAGGATIRRTRESDAGLDPTPDPGSRRNTGNPRDVPDD